MNVTPYLELKPAPRAIFDSLNTRSSRPRYMVPTAEGDYRAVTWGAHAKQIRAATLFLAAEGFHRGMRAAIFAPNSVEWITAAMAIQSAGGALVPIYPANTAPQAGYVVQHSDATVLFVDTAPLLARVIERWADYTNVTRIVALSPSLELGPVIEGLRAKGVALPPMADLERKLVSWARVQSVGEAADLKDPAHFERLLSAVALDDVAEMLYTSGTSGAPKGVPLTHRNVALNGADWLTCNAPMLGDHDVDLLWLPMSHIFGFGEACLGNTLGWVTYLSEPAKVLQHLKIVQPHVFMSVPAVWEKLSLSASAQPTVESRALALREATGPNLRFCLSGGAGLKREVKEFFHAAGLLIIEGYGLTETSPTLTLNRPDAFRFDSVGKVLPSVEVKLADDGEILAKGPTVFSGYHKDPAASAEVFTADGWFKTGDVGRFTDDGFLQIIDRKKDILVTAGGKNVPPVNIELRFRDDPFISTLVVYGDGRKYLVAAVWLNEAAVEAHHERAHTPHAQRAQATQALVKGRIDEVNAELASFESIKKFAIIDTPLTVESGLLTSTLKIRRKQISQVFAPVFEGLYS